MISVDQVVIRNVIIFYILSTIGIILCTDIKPLLRIICLILQCVISLLIIIIITSKLYYKKRNKFIKLINNYPYLNNRNND